MSEDKKQASQRNKALVKKEDQEQFIQEKFTEDEVKQLQAALPDCMIFNQ